jgi:hypothetical protein
MLQVLKSMASEIVHGLFFLFRVEVKISVIDMSMLAMSGVLLKLILAFVMCLGESPIGIHILSSCK